MSSPLAHQSAPIIHSSSPDPVVPSVTFTEPSPVPSPRSPLACNVDCPSSSLRGASQSTDLPTPRSPLVASAPESFPDSPPLEAPTSLRISGSPPVSSNNLKHQVPETPPPRPPIQKDKEESSSSQIRKRSATITVQTAQPVTKRPSEVFEQGVAGVPNRLIDYFLVVGASKPRESMVLGLDNGPLKAYLPKKFHLP